MNPLKTLYLPITDIFTKFQYPLFLVFPQVTLLKPVEKQATVEENESEDSFMYSSFCQVVTPHPLGSDRDRFLHLVRDISQRNDDYSGQLKSLTLADLSQTTEPGESGYNIMHSMLSSDNGEVKGEEKELYWRSRLILALGEMLDREENDLNTQFSLLNNKESILFDELHGGTISAEDASIFKNETNNNKLLPLHSANMKTRLEAWKILYLTETTDTHKLLLTTSRDVGELIGESYYNLADKTRLFLTSIKLPNTLSNSQKQSFDLVRSFHDNFENNLTHLHNILTSLTKTNSEETSDIIQTTLPTEIKAVQYQLDSTFQPQLHQQRTLSFYLLSDISCDSLLRDKLTQEEKSNTILCVLK